MQLLTTGSLLCNSLSTTIGTGNNYQLLIDSSGNIIQNTNYYYDQANSYFTTAASNFIVNVPSTYSYAFKINGTTQASIDTNGNFTDVSNKSSGFAGSKVLYSNGTTIAESTITSTTLGYLDAKSSIQTQLNAKTPLANYYFLHSTDSSIILTQKVHLH